jgi:hypothetical protein
MRKTLESCCMAAVMMAFCVSSDAQDTSQKANDKAPAATAAQPAAKGEKPKSSPGWVVIEEDWFAPHGFGFSDALHRARAHYRAREERSAADEIEKAISWLKYAEIDADKSYAGNLSTARADLMDFAATLRNGGKIEARKLDSSFAHAYAALAKYHHFKADKAWSEDDLKTAGHHLMMAADLIQDAARSANVEYGKEIAEIANNYSPFGYWDESIVFEKNQLESNLKAIATELKNLATETGAKH